MNLFSIYIWLLQWYLSGLLSWVILVSLNAYSKKDNSLLLWVPKDATERFMQVGTVITGPTIWFFMLYLKVKDVVDNFKDEDFD